MTSAGMGSFVFYKGGGNSLTYIQVIGDALPRSTRKALKETIFFFLRGPSLAGSQLNRKMMGHDRWTTEKRISKASVELWVIIDTLRKGLKGAFSSLTLDNRQGSNLYSKREREMCSTQPTRELVDSTTISSGRSERFHKFRLRP